MSRRSVVARPFAILGAALLVFAACSDAAPSVAAEVPGAGGTGGSGEGADDPHRADLLEVTPLAGSAELPGPFSTSLACAKCHASSEPSAAMRDGAGRGIAPFDLWRSTMMANAARDPIFRAQLAAETQRAPEAAAAIEATCLSCHAPALSHERASRNAPPPRLADLSEGGDDAHRGLDGVTCIVCHRIAPEGLGTEESFDAGYSLGPDDVIYGPYATPFTGPMVNQAGFTPTHGSHIEDSALCGSCHTLVTHALRPDGTATGVAFDEQTPFLDYRASAFPAEGVNCQSCHVPRFDEDGAPISTRIARTPNGGDFPRTSERSPYGRHVFVGGNTLVPQLYRDEPVLGATAPAEAFDATRAAARMMLEDAATLAIGALEEGPSGTFTYPLTITSETGHKLPAGYPARRIVLHVRVLDAEGRVLLESGRLDENGRLVDGSGTPLATETDPARYEPHRDVIEGANAVLVYEQVPGDEAGLPTTSLLAAAHQLKDNRILPRGFDPRSPDGARVAPVGVDEDADFVGGSDTVRIVVRGTRPARIEATLLYQTLGPRWRDGLARSATPWAVALGEMLDRADTEAVVMTRAERAE